LLDSADAAVGAPTVAPAQVLTVEAEALAHALFQCLGCTIWSAGQLQQLVLPGDVEKAAAALQDLQQQQQLLQQALMTALWRLNKTAAVLAGDQHTQIASPPPQHQDVSSSSSSSSRAHTVPVCLVEAPAAALGVWASSEPTGPLNIAELSPAGLPLQYLMTAGCFAAVIGRELPTQLQGFGSALWSALPQPRCCNNVACANLGGVSDAKQVAGEASRCSKCKVAK
jgi:hypothetical protein